MRPGPESGESLRIRLVARRAARGVDLVTVAGEQGLWVLKGEHGPLAGEERPRALQSGIDPDRPRRVARTIASTLVAEALAPGLLPELIATRHAGRPATLGRFVSGYRLDTLFWTEGGPVAGEGEPAVAPAAFAWAWCRARDDGQGCDVVLDRTALARLGRLRPAARRLLGVARRRRVRVQAMMQGVAPPLDDPELRRGLVGLEWLDALLAQTDRHTGNILILPAADGTVAGVVGIDQDWSFGARLDGAHLARIRPRAGDARPEGAFHFEVGLPCLADAGMSAALRRLDVAALDRRLADLLTAEERLALRSRLATILVHLARLEAGGRILHRRADWSRPAVERLLLGRPSHLARLEQGALIKSQLGESLWPPARIALRLGLDLRPAPAG